MSSETEERKKETKGDKERIFEQKEYRKDRERTLSERKGDRKEGRERSLSEDRSKDSKVSSSRTRDRERISERKEDMKKKDKSVFEKRSEERKISLSEEKARDGERSPSIRDEDQKERKKSLPGERSRDRKISLSEEKTRDRERILNDQTEDMEKSKKSVSDRSQDSTISEGSVSHSIVAYHSTSTSRSHSTSRSSSSVSDSLSSSSLSSGLGKQAAYSTDTSSTSSFSLASSSTATASATASETTSTSATSSGTSTSGFSSGSSASGSSSLTFSKEFPPTVWQYGSPSMTPYQEKTNVRQDTTKKIADESIRQCTNFVSKLVEDLHRDWSMGDQQQKADTGLVQSKAKGLTVSQMYESTPSAVTSPAAAKRKGSCGNKLNVSLPQLQRQVVARLCQLPSEPPALHVLDRSVDSDVVSRASDRMSLKTRSLAFKDGNPDVACGRVTTPDIAETQKVKKTNHKMSKNASQQKGNGKLKPIR
jgi:hypothetical protein